MAVQGAGYLWLATHFTHFHWPILRLPVHYQIVAYWPTACPPLSASGCQLVPVGAGECQLAAS